MNDRMDKGVGELERISAEVYRACLRLLRRNRALGRLHGTALNLQESHLLSELDAHVGASMNFLAEVMALNQSWVSRTISKLTREGYLSLKHSQIDQRRKQIGITSRGRAAMSQIDKRANQLLREFTVALSRRELEELCSLMARFCDGFGVHRSAARSGEHALRVEQRRLARVLRLLEAEKGSGKLDSAEHLVLTVLADRFRPITASELTEELTWQRSAASVIIKQLALSKLIVTYENQRDRRGQLIALSENGHKVLDSSNSAKIKRVSTVLTSFSATERVIFLTLFKRLVGQRSEAQFRKRFIKRRAVSEKDRLLARTFYLTQMAAMGMLEAVPESLFTADRLCFVLEERSQVVAAIQIRRRGSSLVREAYACSLASSDWDMEAHFLAWAVGSRL